MGWRMRLIEAMLCDMYRTLGLGAGWAWSKGSGPRAFGDPMQHTLMVEPVSDAIQGGRESVKVAYVMIIF